MNSFLKIVLCILAFELAIIIVQNYDVEDELLIRSITTAVISFILSSERIRCKKKKKKNRKKFKTQNLDGMDA